MNTKQITDSIIQGNSLKAIAASYSEISALKLKRIRGHIERNRDFAYELLEIFGVLKNIASKAPFSSPVLKRLINKNGRTICLVITSNSRFYGSLEQELMGYFVNDVNNHRPSQVIVIGKTGAEYLRVNYSPLHYDNLLFNTDLPTPQELDGLIKTLADYKKVIIYHSTFKTVLTQKAVATDITSSVSESQNIGISEKQTTETPKLRNADTLGDFILEPELEAMLQFFDSQILALLTEDIFLEEELSKTAARLISMTQAESNASKFLTSQRRLLLSSKRSVNQSRLLQTYVNFSKWRANDQ